MLTDLVDLSLGAAPSMVSLHSDTIRKMKYEIKTRMGISESFYQHTQETPIHSNGQGACDSPGQWCFISELLSRVVEDEAHGANLGDPTGEIFATETTILICW